MDPGLLHYRQILYNLSYEQSPMFRVKELKEMPHNPLLRSTTWRYWIEKNIRGETCGLRIDTISWSWAFLRGLWLEDLYDCLGDVTACCPLPSPPGDSSAPLFSPDTSLLRWKGRIESCKPLIRSSSTDQYLTLSPVFLTRKSHGIGTRIQLTQNMTNWTVPPKHTHC